MRVLLADSLSESVVEKLTFGECVVDNRPELKGESLTEALRALQPQVLVVRSTKVTAADFQAAKSLELVVRAGAGYDNIDVSTASGLGVFVANCPGKNAAAVAELTIGLLLSLDRSLPDNVSDARNGMWNKEKYGEANGVKGKTIGIIGLGSIGKEVIKRAKGLEMNIVAWSRSLTPEMATELGVQYKGSPIEVASVSDVVTLHVASSAGTKHLANSEFFTSMKPGAFFINTTRADVVDESAMLQCIAEKGIRVGLDVFSNEPAGKSGAFEHYLANNSSIYLTHHIGASTEQAQEAIAEEAGRIILVYAQTGEVPNCVNLAKSSPANHQLTVRHLDKVGVLARILKEMSIASWNVQEMENVVFDEAKAACAYIRFDGLPDNEVVEKIAALDDILAVNLIQL